MATLDWIVIAAYFLGLLLLAWWVILKNKDTADDYFLAGRNLGWMVIGASIFASNIGSEHLVGLAGSGATSGVALADIGDYIDSFYNCSRRHSHLGGVSPEQFEAAHMPLKQGVH